MPVAQLPPPQLRRNRATVAHRLHALIRSCKGLAGKAGTGGLLAWEWSQRIQSVRVGGGSAPSGGLEATAAADWDMVTGGVAASVYCLSGNRIELS